MSAKSRTHGSLSQKFTAQVTFLFPFIMSPAFIFRKTPWLGIMFHLFSCSIIAQERLNRITQFVNEMALTTYVPSESYSQEEVNENASNSPHSSDNQIDWKTSAIPLHSAVALTAAAAGLVPDDGVTSPPFKNWEPQSPESITMSETSELSHSREYDREAAKSSVYIDDNTSEASEYRFNSSGRMNGCYGNGHTSPDVGAILNSRNRTVERLGSPDSLFRWQFNWPWPQLYMNNLNN